MVIVSFVEAKRSTDLSACEKNLSVDPHIVFTLSNRKLVVFVYFLFKELIEQTVVWAVQCDWVTCPLQSVIPSELWSLVVLVGRMTGVWVSAHLYAHVPLTLLDS